MSAQSNIVLADGQTTPVNHTFEPNGSFANSDATIKSAWVDRTGASTELARVVMREDHRPSSKGSRERIRTVLEVPVVEVVNGVNVRSRLHVIDFEIRFDPGALQVERDNVAAYAKNIVASAYFQSKVKTGERTW